MGLRLGSGWASRAAHLMKKPYHQDFRIEKGEIEHPTQAGFRKSLGEPKGQEADWRSTLPDGSCIHVLEYPGHYVFHKDKRNPDSDPWGHLWEDAPHWLMIIGLIVAAAIGGAAYGMYELGKKKRDTGDSR